jgi:hypothetical protein
MKRLSIFGAALCAAAMFILVCTSVEYDNPYDLDSDNFGKFPGGGDYSEDMREYLNNNPDAGGKELNDFIATRCDKSNPKVTLVGGRSVEIKYNTTQGRTEFERLMGRSASNFVGVIEYEEGAGINPKAELCLPGQYNPLASQEMPNSEGEYVIRYTVTKPPCEGITPSGDAERTVVFKLNIDADTVVPVITINRVGGEIDQVVSVGSSYNDAGASASAGGVMRDPVSNVNTNQPGNYTVVYTACKTLIYGDGRPEKDTCVSATRRVTVQETVQPTKVTPIIVLNTYKHEIDGKTYNLRDTVFRNTPSDADFRDIGVKELFYIKDGKKEKFEANVTVTRGSFGNQRTIKYTLAATNDYGAAEETRYGYVLDPICEDNFDKPTITFQPSGTTDLTITAGTPWNHGASWRATNMDESNLSDSKLGIDFGTLDPNFPAAGTYTVTYVAFGGCRQTGFTTRTRTIIVQ